MAQAEDSWDTNFRFPLSRMRQLPVLNQPKYIYHFNFPFLELHNFNFPIHFYVNYFINFFSFLLEYIWNSFFCWKLMVAFRTSELTLYMAYTVLPSIWCVGRNTKGQSVFEFSRELKFELRFSWRILHSPGKYKKEELN